MGVGVYKDPVKAVDALVKLTEVMYPNEENHNTYNKLYHIYRKFKSTFWSLFDELAQIYGM